MATTKRQVVDGREMTLSEAATLAGRTANAFRIMADRLGSWQAALDHYRSGRCNTQPYRGLTWTVDGEELGAAQMAERAGVSETAFRMRMYHTGKDAPEVLAGYLAGEYETCRSRAANYDVDGRRMTAAQVAAAMGVSVPTFYGRRRRHPEMDAQALVDWYRSGGAEKDAEAARAAQEARKRATAVRRAAEAGQPMPPRDTDSAAGQLRPTYPRGPEEKRPAPVWRTVDAPEPEPPARELPEVGTTYRPEYYGGADGMRYYVDGEMMTMAQAARRAGISTEALRRMAARTGMSVQKCVRWYRDMAALRDEAEAERAIMDALACEG